MTPAKLNVFFSFYPYSGSGGVSSEHPSIRKWFARTLMAVKRDERIANIHTEDYADTPITMTRNRAVCQARNVGADVLVMIDSDQWPDLYLPSGGIDDLYGVQKSAEAKPFFESSFDFLYSRRIEGKPVVVGAPYCGPPPNEVVYVFKWASRQSDHPNPDLALQMYTREEVVPMIGIHPCAALPTGCIMFDMKVFDVLPPPYFYYEYTDEFQQEKASTEDVTCTRDIALHGMHTWGHSPIHCNWSAWAGHMKPKCVGKPSLIHSNHVSRKYREAVLRDLPNDKKLIFVRNGKMVENGQQKLEPLSMEREP